MDSFICQSIMVYAWTFVITGDSYWFFCENGLLTINRNFVFEHLDDNSEALKANLINRAKNYWESAWFSLGYATDTQTLREIFLKTNINLILTAISNRTQRNILIKPRRTNPKN